MAWWISPPACCDHPRSRAITNAREEARWKIPRFLRMGGRRDNTLAALGSWPTTVGGHDGKLSRAGRRRTQRVSERKICDRRLGWYTHQARKGWRQSRRRMASVVSDIDAAGRVVPRAQPKSTLVEMVRTKSTRGLTLACERKIFLSTRSLGSSLPALYKSPSWRRRI